MPKRPWFACWVLAATCAWCFASPTALAQNDAASQTETAAEEAWSLDDLHDVTEMAYFVSMTLGTAALLYWLFMRYPAAGRNGPPLEFAVDAVAAGVQGSTRLIEVVATVKNLGRSRVELADFRFTLSTIRPASDAVGPLATSGALEPLFEAPFAGPLAFVDPGVAARFGCPVAIGGTVIHLLIAGHLRTAGSRSVQEVSKLIAL